MSYLLSLFFVGLVSFNFSWAETSREIFLPGEQPPTADQPWKHENNQMTADSDTLQGRDTSIPPVKGVIHVRMENQGSDTYAEYLNCLKEMRDQMPEPRAREAYCDSLYLDPENAQSFSINYTGISSIEPDTEEYPIFIPGRRGIGYLPTLSIEGDVLQRPVVYRSYDLTQSHSNQQVVQLPVLQLKDNGFLSHPVLVLEALVNQSNAAEQIASFLGIPTNVMSDILKSTGSAFAITESGVGLLIPNFQMFSEIDPERERPIDFNNGLPGFLWTKMETDIDPEREWPILGGEHGIILKITIPGIAPWIEPGIDIPAMVSAFHPVGTTHPDYPFPVINVPPAKMAALTDWGDTFPPPGQVDVPKFQIIRDIARNLADPNLKIYTVELTTVAVLGSLTIMAYKLLGVGGRARALAAVIPPQVIYDATGRAGYRVPAHDTYTEEDALSLARQVQGMGNSELEAFLNTVDPELIEYMELVDYYVRHARGVEFQQWCPDINQCS